MNSRWQYRWLTALVVVHVALLVANVLAVWSLHLAFYEEDEFLGWYCAVPLAQASLGAVWHLWGSRRAIRRVPPPSYFILGAAFLSLVVLYPHYLSMRTGNLLCLLFATQLLLMHGLTAIPRFRRGWRIKTTQTHEPATLIQFSRVQFVMWMVALTLLFHAGRWLIEFHGAPTPQWTRTSVLPILLGGNLILSWLAIWAALVRQSGLLWVSIASLLAMVLTAAEIVLIQICRISMLISEVFLWALNGSQFALLLGSLMLLHSCGFRLQRRGDIKASNDGVTVPRL